MCVKKKEIDRGKFPCERARVCINKKIFKHLSYVFIVSVFSSERNCKVLFVSKFIVIHFACVLNRIGIVFVMLLGISRDKRFS